ncbi:MAG: hypothetical protein AB8B94_05300 [Hyphomicrobiales bacterium]
MTSRLWKRQAFCVSYADASEFESQGLRAFFEYRAMGLRQATKRKFGAHVIRAISGKGSEAK